MARMSIDDMFLRDPRVDCVGAAVGLDADQIRGRMLWLFAMVYDRETDVLPDHLIDAAVRIPGFASQMIRYDLAERVEVCVPEMIEMVRIRGASDRIAYLIQRREAGRSGGVASGKARGRATLTPEAKPGRVLKRGAKRRSSEPGTTAKASRNPPDRVPDPVPDSDLVPDPAVARVPDTLIGDRATRAPKRKARLPDDWAPSADHEQLGRELGVDARAEAAQFADHWRAKGEARADWDASFRTWLRNARRFAGGPRASVSVGRYEPRQPSEYPDGEVPL